MRTVSFFLVLTDICEYQWKFSSWQSLCNQFGTRIVTAAVVLYPMRFLQETLLLREDIRQYSEWVRSECRNKVKGKLLTGLFVGVEDLIHTIYKRYDNFNIVIYFIRFQTMEYCIGILELVGVVQCLGCSIVLLTFVELFNFSSYCVSIWKQGTQALSPRSEGACSGDELVMKDTGETRRGSQRQLGPIARLLERYELSLSEESYLFLRCKWELLQAVTFVEPALDVSLSGRNISEASTPERR